MKPLFLYFLLIPVVFICSCHNDDDNGQNPAGGKVVLVTKDITVPTTWHADSIYVIKDQCR